jgi:hypothetical protein
MSEIENEICVYEMIKNKNKNNIGLDLISSKRMMKIKKYTVNEDSIDK